jgi:threonine dehydratase
MTSADVFQHSERTLPPPSELRAAATRVAPYTRRTPVLHAAPDGRPVVFKLEHLQVTGSFKIRGALNAMLCAGAADGNLAWVVTASGGNHGLGVAAAARWLGVPATVFVPGNVPEVKARRIADAGAEVVRTGDRYADAERAALELAAREDAYYLHAYDDPAVVAGQATVGLEIVADAPECDTVAVAVGGGGLLAGVSAAVAPRRAIAVEPAGCPAMHAAAKAGRPADAEVGGVAASALGATRVGELAFAAYSAFGIGLAMVSEDEIVAARDRLWEEFRLAVEPAAATVFAAWLAGRVPGDHPCLILSGANAAWTP